MAEALGANRIARQTWIDPVVWWHVYPLGMTGVPIRDRSADDGTDQHRLRRLITWLDHLVDLGCTGLQLGPIFASTSHGYDTIDHLCIDPRLGDDDDFDALVDACRARGIRLILDGVFNHVSADHPWARAARRGEDSPIRMVTTPDGQHHPMVFEGSSDLLELDHSRPEVADLVGRVMGYWLDRGIDGWRLDAAYAVPPEFWAWILPGIRQSHPQAWFVGEVIHGDYAQIVRQSGLDGVTQYELWKATWSAIRDANFFELAWALDRHRTFCSEFVPMTFVGNHDVMRIAERVGDLGSLMAHALLLCVSGSASLYYGDEYAFRGVKENRPGGDDAVRPEFPATPAELVSPGEWFYNELAAMVRLRRDRPWLTQGSTEVVEHDNTRMLVRTSTPDASQQLWLELDLTSGHRIVMWDAGGELYRLEA